MNPASPNIPGATVVITHRVKDGQQQAYAGWLDEVGPLCRAFPGHLDWQVIRPVANLTSTYTVILRFDTDEHLRAWMDSAERRQMIERVRPLLATDDDFHIRSGLDFWFTPEGARATVPVRWKQFLVTVSAVYPLVLAIPPALAPVVRAMDSPLDRYLGPLLVAGTLVFLMIYVVMPPYTRLLRRWLFE